MRIVTPKDTGRIRVVSSLPNRDVRLEILADHEAPEHRQWFCFEAHDAGGAERVFVLENASECTYADAFEGYRVCASYDPESPDWFRVHTEEEDGALRIVHEPRADVVRYAYFAPYPRRRRARVVEEAKAAGALVTKLGTSVRGEAMELLTFGSESEHARKLWFVAQQHPGETMAGWFAEGLVGRLLDRDDPMIAELLRHARVFVVLSMNPDGATRGNHRTNAAGKDLNRAWWEASETESPEVLAVRAAMYREGADFFLDVHGDEHVPAVFFAGAEGNPHYTDRIEALEGEMTRAMLEATRDFQTDDGYPKDAPGKGDLRCAGNYVGEAFDCLSFTLEMPFKDHRENEDEERGWSPERSMGLAAATLEAVSTMIDVLRD